MGVTRGVFAIYRNLVLTLTANWLPVVAATQPPAAGCRRGQLL